MYTFGSIDFGNINMLGWLGEHSTTKSALTVYGIGAGACILLYGVRKGVKGLRQYHIEQESKKDSRGKVKVEAETALDRVLFESLKGCAQGIVPSLVWPAHIGAYAIVKWKEDEIVEEVKRELEEVKREADEPKKYDVCQN